MTKQETCEFLDSKNIEYEKMEHKAAFTMEELKEIPLPHPEAEAKNLFLKSKRGNKYYLVTVKGSKRVNINDFRRKYNLGGVCFAEEEELYDILKLLPGSVTPLGLLNDEERITDFYLDECFVEEGLVGCHPNDNTATVWIKTEDLIKIIKEHGNRVQLAEL